MTDVLSERFGALADRTDDSNWPDVRRRARRRARLVVPAALVAAAVVAAGAVAATGHWIFSAHARSVTASTHVRVGNTTYRASITMKGAGKICFSIAPPNKPPSWDRYCSDVGGNLTLHSENGTMVTLLAPGPAFRAISLRVRGGEVVAGASIDFARRIELTDAKGRVYSTQTIAAPRGTKTPFRFWAIGLEGTTASAIAAYDARGLAIRKTITVK